MNSSNNNVCSLNPSQKDNIVYGRMLKKLNELSSEISVPFYNDPAFKEALSILQQTNPKNAVNEMRNLNCSLNQNVGGKGRRSGKKTRSKNLSRKMRKLKGKSLRLKRRGGTGNTPANTQHGSRVRCYLRVLAKITAVIAGVGYAGYWLLFPFLSSAIATPCSGITDQAFSTIMSFVNKDMSCSARQAAYDGLVTQYVTGLSTVSGLTVGGMLWASPKLFGLFTSYLLSKECPQTYGTMTFEELLSKWDETITNVDVKHQFKKAIEENKKEEEGEGDAGEGEGEKGEGEKGDGNKSLNNPDVKVGRRQGRK